MRACLQTLLLKLNFSTEISGIQLIDDVKLITRQSKFAPAVLDLLTLARYCNVMRNSGIQDEVSNSKG